MLDSRYDIRGKLHEDLLGPSYRGFDRNLNRDVIIRRLDLPKDAIESISLTKLRSHIAGENAYRPTIFDIGKDNDGFYLVMQAHNDQSIDEFQGGPPMSFEDFLVFVAQSLEALHQDPDNPQTHGNLNLNNIRLRRESSKQLRVKIYDHGLLELTPAAVQHRGSDKNFPLYAPHFKAPERLRGEGPSIRSDLFSLGIILSYALLGHVPFGGNNVEELLADHKSQAHLPLTKQRPELPSWVVRWLHWLLKEDPKQRPATAEVALRALQQAQKGDLSALPELPAKYRSTPATPTTAIPRALPAQPVAATPTVVASSSTPSVSVRPTSTPGAQPAKKAVNKAAQKALPAFGSNLSKASKIAIGLSLGLLLTLAFLVLGAKLKKKRHTDELHTILGRFANNNVVKEVPLNARQIDLLLEETVVFGKSDQRETLFEALYRGVPTDGTNLDLVIARFATTREMSPDVQRKLFRVLRLRGHESALPHLIDFAKKGNVTAPEALEAAEKMTTPQNFEDLLDIIRHAQRDEVRRAAERALASAISSSPASGAYSGKILSVYRSEKRPEIQEIFLRLMGIAGGPQAAEAVREALRSDRQTLQLAALRALAVWPTRELFDDLMSYTEKATDSIIRSEAFDTVLKTLATTKPTPKHPDEASWVRLASFASFPAEQVKVLSGLATHPEPWALELARSYETEDATDTVLFQTQKVIKHLEKTIASAQKAKGN